MTKAARKRSRRLPRREPTAVAKPPVKFKVRPFLPDLLIGTGLFLFALTLRIVYVLQLQDNPLFAHPVMDELYHDDWAWHIAQGQDFVEGPYFRAPLYPALLGMVYKIFGHTYLAPRIVQAGLGSLSCVLLFALGRIAFCRSVGVLSGFAAATYWMLIYFDGELLIPSLIVFLDLAMLTLLMLQRDKPRHLVMMLAGLTLGLSAIARPNILLFAPAIVAWVVVHHQRHRRRAILSTVVLALATLAVVLPVTVRNWTVGKDKVLIASQGGVNFYIGNNLQSDGRTAIVPGTPSGWWEGYRAAIARAEESRGKSLKPSEVSDYYYEQAVEFIRSQPGQFLSLLILKSRLFWTRFEISNNKGIYFWTNEFTPVVRFLPLGFAVIGPLGLMGLVLVLRRPIHYFPLWGFVVVYTISVVLFFCTSRYRMPVIPVLILLGAHALIQLIRSGAQRKWKPLVIGGVTLLPAIWLVFVPPETAPFRNEAFSRVRLGTAYGKMDRPEQAMDAYRRAIDEEPLFATAHFNLGQTLRKQGRTEEANLHFRKVLESARYRLASETDELFSEAHFTLAEAAYSTGDLARAITHYLAAIELDANTRPGRLHFNLALVLREASRPDEARQQFEFAIEPLRIQAGRDPANAQVQYALGRSLLETNRLAEAVEPLTRVWEAKPNDAIAINQLSRTLVATRQYEDAINVLSRSVHITNKFIRNRLALLLASAPQEHLRDSRRALQLALELCPDAPNCDPRYLDTSAAVMAEMGMFDDAKRFAGRAIELLAQSPDPGHQALLAEVRGRLNGYEQGRPFRLPE